MTLADSKLTFEQNGATFVFEKGEAKTPPASSSASGGGQAGSSSSSAS
jgi:hypothetical protein